MSKKTVLNEKNIDTTQQPIFLGEPLSLQRFDRFKYEQFMELWRNQVELLWTPEEFELTKDRQDYLNMTEVEKFIFTKNLQYQTMMDSVVARGASTFIEYVSLPEVEICMSFWAMMEGIHSYSYTYIMRNVYADPTPILDETLEDEEIMKRARTVKEEYDKLDNFAGDDIKKQIYLTLMSVYILESIRFYVSFVCSFAFNQRSGMMEGNTNIIRKILLDECVDGETELLTPFGWKMVGDITYDDKIAQYNDDGTIEFVNPVKLSQHKVDTLYKFANRQNHFNLAVSSNHRMIYKKEGKLEEKFAKEFVQSGDKYLPMAGNLIGERDKLTSLERFLIAYQADGIKLRDVDTGKYNGGWYNVKIVLKKERKISRLIDIIEECGFDYKTVITNRGQTKFTVRVKNTIPVSKKLSTWLDLSDKSHKWCEDFINEVGHWDGYFKRFSVDTVDGVTYGSVIEENSDWVQAISVLAGYRCKKRTVVDERSETFSDYHRLEISYNKSNITLQKLNTSIEKGEFNVYGVEVPSGMIIVRRKGGVCVTGNSQHVKISQTCMNLFATEKSEGFYDTIQECREQVIQMFLTAATEEKEWADYLFSKGPMVGLSAEVLKGYVEYLVDQKMQAIGLPAQFGTKNPVGGWLDEYLNTSMVQTEPQASPGLTQYKRFVTKPDLGSVDIDF